MSNLNIENLKRFAAKHDLILEQEGEVGFGRECVGFIDKRGNHYVEYNPLKEPDYDYIEELYDDRFFNLATPNAYHKSNCLCVLGRGEDALNELNEWITSLENEGELTVERFSTGATGVQAMLSGTHGYALKFLNKEEY